MSTPFKPIEIPAGVVSTPTKKQRSSNWSEVNLIRWREGQLMPMGGQAQLSRQVNVTVAATGAFTTASTTIGMATNPGTIRPGMTVYDVTSDKPVGVVKSFGPGSGSITAAAAFTTNYAGIAMPPNPGWVTAGMTVTDTTSSHVLGTVSSYAPKLTVQNATQQWHVGDTTVTMGGSPVFQVIPGMTITDTTTGGALGTVVSWIGTTLTWSAPATFGSATLSDHLQFSSGSNHVLTLAAASAFASAGANDVLQFGGATNWVLTLMAPAANASSGSTDQLRFEGEGYSFASRCKRIHGWFGLDGVYRIAYLCEQHLYVDTGGVLMDISPTPPLVAPSGLVGGYGDGLYDTDLYGTPRLIPSSVAITKIPDAYSLDNFGSILYAMTSADSRLLMWDPGAGVPGAAASLVAAGAITTGSPNITMPTNPGTVTPGMSVYNTTKSLPVGTVLTYVGTALVLTANAANAGVLGDVLAFGNVAVTQPASSGRGPVPNGRCFVVTQERFIMIFGSTNDGSAGGSSGGGPRRFAWCDQENPGAWDYTNVTSMAGWLDVEPASPIITACASRVGTIFWTAKKVYASRFLGSPYIYNYVELADGTTPWSPQSVTTTSSLTLWMSEQGPFSYDGTSVLPVKCMVRPWIDDDIDPVAVRELSFACHVGEFNEWWWFYPTLNSPFNTRAAIYSYKEGWWTQARLSRSAGITSSYTAHPIFADDYVAIQHEIFQATSYVNVSMPVEAPFAETFDLNLASGARLTTVKQLMPDVEALNPTDANAAQSAISNLRYSMFYRRSRSLGDPELQTPKVPVRSDGYVDFRITGRDLRLRIDMDSASVQPFTLGAHLIDAVPRGDR
jgi:hypothetical protein